MKIAFISDDLSIDESFVPLSELIDLESLGVGYPEDGEHTCKAMELAKKNSALILQSMREPKPNVTYFLRMPKGAIAKWRVDMELNESLREEYKTNSLCAKRRVLIDLLSIDYPGWTPIRPTLPTSLFFACTHITVVSKEFVIFVKGYGRD